MSLIHGIIQGGESVHRNLLHILRAQVSPAYGGGVAMPDYNNIIIIYNIIYIIITRVLIMGRGLGTRLLTRVQYLNTHHH